MKRITFLAILVTVLFCGFKSYTEQKNIKNENSLTLANVEALTAIEVVGCKPMQGATCYVFSGGQLVDRRKNQYPG